MKIALDTNIAIDLLNNDSNTIRLIESFEEICLPITVCGELLYGALNSQKSTQNIKNYSAFIKSCITLNTNSLAAEEYASIRLGLKKKGRPIPENDIWIAAICKINDVPLYTRDKHFGFIEGLRIV